MIDPLERLAQMRLMALAANVQNQLDHAGPDAKPVLFLLAQARIKARQALAGLCDVDPEDVKAVRNLQNEVRIYTDLINFVAKTLNDGDEIDHRLEADEREEMREMFKREDVKRELSELGINPPEDDEETE